MQDDNKPLILKIEELKETLFNAVTNAINEEGIPCYFIEPILSRLSSEIKEMSMKDLKKVREIYEQTKINRRNGK